jgi:hypothetical protein
MIGQPPAPLAAPAPGFQVFWTMLGRIVLKLIAERAHGDVIITLKDGAVQLVRLHTSYLPGQLPRV